MASWIQLIEKNLQSLIELQSTRRLGAEEGAYLDVLLAYLQGDLVGLEHAVARVEKVHGASSLVTVISRLRLLIRQRKVTAKVVQVIEASAKGGGELEGEAYFVAGLAWEVLEDHERGMDAFTLAAEMLARVVPCVP